MPALKTLRDSKEVKDRPLTLRQLITKVFIQSQLDEMDDFVRTCTVCGREARVCWMCRNFRCKFLGHSDCMLEHVRDCDKPLDLENATEEEVKKLRLSLEVQSEDVRAQSQELESILTRASKQLSTTAAQKFLKRGRATVAIATANPRRAVTPERASSKARRNAREASLTRAAKRQAEVEAEPDKPK